jgi:hypothetical protein
MAIDNIAKLEQIKALLRRAGERVDSQSVSAVINADETIDAELIIPLRRGVQVQETLEEVEEVILG